MPWAAESFSDRVLLVQFMVTECGNSVFRVKSNKEVGHVWFGLFLVWGFVLFGFF